MFASKHAQSMANQLSRNLRVKKPRWTEILPMSDLVGDSPNHFAIESESGLRIFVLRFIRTAAWRD